MNRTDRLYALAEELRAAGPKGRTAAWLADRFEVAGRTVKRDVSALQQSGLPVHAQGGPGGGYVLDQRATLPPVAFTAGEATAVAVALAASPDLPFAADGRSALTKLLAAMPEDARDRVQHLASQVWVRTSPGTRRPPVARVLDESLRECVVVVLDYLDRDGAATRRPVEPLAYALDGGRWYLLAWCRTRGAGRWFRLDRIQAAWPTREPVTTRDVEEVFGAVPAGVASAAPG